MGAKDQIDEGNPLQHFLAELLGKTTADANDQVRFVLFQEREPPQLTVYLLGGFFPNTARIDEDHIRFGGTIRFFVTERLKKGHDLFRIVDVHLTAECLYIKFFYRQPLNYPECLFLGCPLICHPALVN